MYIRGLPSRKGFSKNAAGPRGRPKAPLGGGGEALPRLQVHAPAAKGRVGVGQSVEAATGALHTADHTDGVPDIALYAYTHVAHEGDFDLSGYPSIRAWLARVEAQPGHVPISA